MTDSAQSSVASETPDSVAQGPAWVLPMVSRAAWRVAGVVITIAVAYLALSRARGLVSMLVIALFFGFAMHPGVTSLSHRFGWSRGASTAVIFLGLIVFCVGLVLLVIPATVEVTQRVTDRLPNWLDTIETRFDVTIADGTHQDLAGELYASLASWVENSWQKVLGLASGLLGLVFQLFTIATFTFYFTADAPKLQRVLLRRFRPDRQRQVGWALDTAITQTGGYFYSRLLLMTINASLYFVAMLLVGVTWSVALPMSIFQGFFAEFIPTIGTYIGAAVPILVTLGLQGFVPALILLAWTIVYQQVENYFLSPRISAKTMELNGGVAFAAALAGGAIAGPMGAFMALPIAAWTTVFLKHYGHSYPLVYQSAHVAAGDADDSSAAVDKPGSAAPSPKPAGS